jgi:hypothetical protein
LSLRNARDQNGGGNDEEATEKAKRFQREKHWRKIAQADEQFTQRSTYYGPHLST